MARRHGRRAAAHDSLLADLDLVLADDARIDQIGTGPWPARPSVVARPGAHRASGRHQRAATWQHRADGREPLLDLFEQWRLELAERPLPTMAVPPVRSGSPVRSGRPTRRYRPDRPTRSLLAVVAAIGALVVGTATIAAADAEPGSALWPIARVLWPARAQSAESARAVQVALDEARVALDSGRGRDARAAIIRAFGELPNVEDGDARDSMQNAVVALWAESVPPRPNGPGSTTSPPPPRPSPTVSPIGPTDPGGPTPGDGRAEAATPAVIEAMAPRPAPADQAAPTVDPASAASTPAAPIIVSTAASSAPAPPSSATAADSIAAPAPSMPPVTPTPPAVPAPPTAEAPTPTTSASPSTTQQSAPSPTAISEDGGSALPVGRSVPGASPAPERDSASSGSAVDTASTTGPTD